MYSIKFKMMKGVLASTPALRERNDVSRDTEACLNVRADGCRMRQDCDAGFGGCIFMDCLTINTVCHAF
jgi:hypothetical protein